MNELNVYTYRRPARFYLCHPLRAVRDFFRRLRWARQRAVRGYADTDVWDMDEWFLRVLPPMLRDLADSDGYPGDPPFDTESKWTRWLNRMADDIESLQEDWGETRNEYEPEHRKLVEEKRQVIRDEHGFKSVSYAELTDEERALQSMWMTRIEELNKEKLAFTKKIFAELAEHFYNLWS